MKRGDICGEFLLNKRTITHYNGLVFILQHFLEVA